MEVDSEEVGRCDIPDTFVMSLGLSEKNLSREIT